MQDYWKDQALSVLSNEADNLVYVMIAVGIMLAVAFIEMNPAGSKLADMLLGALLIKIKT